MKITSDAITIDQNIYPTKNIASARMVEQDIKVDESDANFSRRRKALLIVSLILLGGTLASGHWLPGVALLVSFSFAFVRRRVDSLEFGIEIVTNAGKSTLLWSQDESFMVKVRDMVFEAISASSRGINYTVNIDNKKIEDHSVTVHDHSTNHIYDYSVNFNEHHGIPAEKIQFLNGEFNDALKQLGTVVQKANNAELESELKDLVELLRKQNPDKGKLRTAWGRVRGVCEVWETGAAASGLLSTIGVGVSAVLAALG